MFIDKIIQLNKDISNKIAAGEVVEKPLAVVKELVENAIDAGASKITVEIKEAGKSYIRVTDNGRGINPSEMELAFERHSTSKIRTINDIYNISSLGFRGEALASIASVSNVEMISKHMDIEMGQKLVLSGGKNIEFNSTGAPQGTTIFIRDLFFNTPARLKFLKSNIAEQNAISDIMNKLALSHPEIAFKYIVAGENVFITPGNNKMFDVILNIFQKGISKNLLEISNEDNGISIKGFISNLDVTRGNRQYQIIFVNNRYVKSKVIESAVALAYRTMIPQNRFPIVFLNIEIDPSLIDINIHPSKTEIRFHQEGVIKDLIYRYLKIELNKYNLVPVREFNSKVVSNKSVLNAYSEVNKINDGKLEVKNTKKNEENIEKDIEVKNSLYPENITEKNTEINESYKNFSKNTYVKQTKEEIKEDREKAKILLNSYKTLLEKKVDSNDNTIIIEDKVLIKASPFVKKIEDKVEHIPSVNLFEKTEETIYDNLKFIGQIFSSYLIYEKNAEMYLIDQHAAHEKILYEEFLDSFKKKNVYSQMILEPITVDVNYMDKSKITNNLELFKNLGFTLEEFGENAMVVREIPQIFNIATAKKLIYTLIENLDFDMPKERFELSLDSIIMRSCKSAVKANDYLDNIEVHTLVNRLKKLKDPYTCPHGRPIIISISRKEIEKKFNRT